MTTIAAPAARPTIYHRFEIGTTISGWEVTDGDGRNVSPSYDNPLIAQQVRDDLNHAAASGPRALASALGCIEEADGWDDEE